MAGRVQAFAAGYFLWDLVISLRYLRVLGLGSLVHAVSALLVTAMGFVSLRWTQTPRRTMRIVFANCANS
jgi:hypothetical protein